MAEAFGLTTAAGRISQWAAAVEAGTVVAAIGIGEAVQTRTCSCSSDDMHRHYCSADTRGGVTLVKQRSDSACRQGYSWGYDRRGIWVDHGCRADFQVNR